MAQHRRVLIIVNPAAGGFSRRRIARIEAALERRGCPVVLRYTTPDQGDAERAARETGSDFDVVVAAGGGGTVSAVANGVAAASGAPTPLALLPFGTANVLAREIGLPRGADDLAELIAFGAARPVWPGRVGDRLFCAMAGSGFDADTVAAVNLSLKRRLGRLAFGWAIAVCLLHYRDRELAVSADGARHRAAAVIAARTRFYAGGFVLAPEADFAEPMLDLVLFDRPGRLAVMRYLAALPRGRIVHRREVKIVRCRNAVISADEPVPVQADGELVGHLPVRLGIAERPLLLIRP